MAGLLFHCCILRLLSTVMFEVLYTLRLNEAGQGTVSLRQGDVSDERVQRVHSSLPPRALHPQHRESPRVFRWPAFPWPLDASRCGQWGCCDGRAALRGLVSGFTPEYFDLSSFAPPSTEMQRRSESTIASAQRPLFRSSLNQSLSLPDRQIMSHENTVVSQFHHIASRICKEHHYCHVPARSCRGIPVSRVPHYPNFKPLPRRLRGAARIDNAVFPAVLESCHQAQLRSDFPAP